jgi:orotate phosphoribosyltransferase
MLRDDLIAIFRARIKRSEGPLPIGREGRIRVNYFLDLLAACHDPPILNRLGGLFADWFRDQPAAKSLQCLAGPKRGNVLFVWQVAANLKVRSVFVRDSILFGQWIEGQIKSGDNVVLIDDVASDGELILDAIDNLKRAGVFVKDVCVLVDRKEGDAEEFLKQSNVKYHFCIQLSDADLAGM